MGRNCHSCKHNTCYILQTEHVMFRNTYIHIHIYVYIYMSVFMYACDSSEKRDHFLKESGEGYMGGLEGGKEREKPCNYIIISKE